MRAGVYRLGAVPRFPVGDETIEVWPAPDVLVLKATALVLTAHLLPKLSPHCYHIEGRGGAKAAVRFVDAHRADNPFVFRTEVKSYNASIDHDILGTSERDCTAPNTTRWSPPSCTEATVQSM